MNAFEHDRLRRARRLWRPTLMAIALLILGLPSSTGRLQNQSNAQAQESEWTAYLPLLLSRAGSQAPKPDIDASAWRYIQSPNFLYDLVFDPATGHVWAASRYAGATRWDPEEGLVEWVRREDGLRSAQIYAVELDRSGGLWMAGEDSWISVRDRSGSWRYFGPEQGFAADEITDLAVGAEGHMFALQEKQLNVMDPAGRWQVEPIPEAADGDEISVMEMDVAPDGTLWIGGLSSLYERSPDGSWRVHPIGNTDPSLLAYVFGISAGPDGQVAVSLLNQVQVRHPDGRWEVHDTWTLEGTPLAFSLAYDDLGQLWIGSDEGILLHHNGRWTIFNEFTWLARGVSFGIAAADGRVFAGLDTGLAVFDEADLLSFQREPGMLDPVVDQIRVDASGTAWMAHDLKGVSRLSADGAWSVHDQDATVDMSDLNAMDMDPAGNLWLGMLTTGLVRLTPEGHWTQFTSENSGLRNEFVDIVHADAAGSIWLGHVLDLPELGMPAGLSLRTAAGDWAQFTVDEGLADDDIQAIETDSLGNVWGGTYEAGLSRLGPDGSWQTFDSSNGLPDDEVWALQAAADGGLWVGTASGLSHRSPSGEWRLILDEEAGTGTIGSLALDDDGTLWIGGAGLSRLSASGELRFLDERVGLAGDGVLDVRVDAQGNVWVASWLAGVSVLSAEAKGAIGKAEPAATTPSSVMARVGRTATLMPRPAAVQELGAWKEQVQGR